MNRRCREHLASLRSAYQRAVALKCVVFGVLGDLYDNERPPPQMTAAVQDIFPLPEEDTPAANHPLGIILLGNHDMESTEADDHALGPLQDRCVIVDAPWRRSAPAWRCELALIPYEPGPAKDWLPKRMKALLSGAKTQTRVLGIHLGIMDEQTPKYLQDAEDAIDIRTLEQLCREHSVSYVFAGNWHNQRVWKRGDLRIVQVGALCPTGWDNPGIDEYGNLVILDTETGMVSNEIIPGPRFLKLIEPDAAAWSAMNTTIHTAAEQGHRIYLEVRAAVAQLDSLREQLLQWQSDGIIAGFDARPSEKEAQAAAKRAADAVKSVSGLEERLAKYIENSAFPPGVDPQRVHARVRRYLAWS